MKRYKLYSRHKKILSDVLTPVSAYLKLRNHFPHSLLLESSDYDAHTNSFSYLCCRPIATISIKQKKVKQTLPDGSTNIFSLQEGDLVAEIIHTFLQRFETKDYPFKFLSNGIFGYIAHDAVEYFESLSFNKKKPHLDIPEIYYAVYQNIIAISLFSHEAHLFSHTYNTKSNLAEIEQLLKKPEITQYHFARKGDKISHLSDNEFIELVGRGKQHCYRGDVYQLVLSRRFSQRFIGDEFNVYRSLRSINPSPYLFFFDYGNFKIFGSSPEAQLIVKDGRAEIHPIAGTFPRTGNDEQDAAQALKLTEDAKENSEHIMLVDLARNDLSRNGTDVKVEKNREIQFYSHVIHLISKVSAQMKNQSKTFQVVADTFPAGTLSGAPKHKALQLIDRYEKISRDFYGGAIGYMDFNGNFNHAIIIRSFLSKNEYIHYQAGAGIVAHSVAQNELQEVYNKLGALDKALAHAETI